MQQVAIWAPKVALWPQMEQPSRSTTTNSWRLQWRLLQARPQPQSQFQPLPRPLSQPLELPKQAPQTPFVPWPKIKVIIIATFIWFPTTATSTSSSTIRSV